MRPKKLLVSGVIFILLISWSYAISASKVPPPPDMDIIPPDPSLPEEIRALLGKWEGTWDYGIPSTLVIEEIDGKRAQLIYKVGPARNLEESSQRIEAKVSFTDGGVKISWSNFNFYYSESRPNILKGMLVNYRGTLFITMKRIQ